MMLCDLTNDSKNKLMFLSLLNLVGALALTQLIENWKKFNFHLMLKLL